MALSVCTFIDVFTMAMHNEICLITLYQNAQTNWMKWMTRFRVQFLIQVHLRMRSSIYALRVQYQSGILKFDL